MQALNDPGYGEHREQRVAGRNRVLEYVKRVQGDWDSAGVAFMNFPKDRLVTYSRGVDKKYSPYLGKRIA